jgi:acyl-CoA thioester hydrolase
MYDAFENDVRFEETDAQGIVFYGNYVTYQDETFTEYLDAIGYEYATFADRGWDVHVVNVELDYRGSAEFRDRLVNSMRISSIRDSSLTFEYQCRRKDDGEALGAGAVRHGADGDDGSPTRVPDDFREAVIEFQDEPPEPV